MKSEVRAEFLQDVIDALKTENKLSAIMEAFDEAVANYNQALDQWEEAIKEPLRTKVINAMSQGRKIHIDQIEAVEELITKEIKQAKLKTATRITIGDNEQVYIENVPLYRYIEQLKQELNKD